jgi:hypothetical protein
MTLKWITNKLRDTKFISIYKTVEGDPKETEKYSATELEEMGVVGIYRVEEL